MKRWLIALLWIIPAIFCPAQEADTDGDGLPDVWESANGLNPNSAADALTDADGDGMSNLLEYALGGNPQQSDRDVLPAGGMVGSDYVLTFNRHISLRYVIQPERNDGLTSQGWTTSGFLLVSRQNLAQNLERVSYRLDPALGAAPRRFVRVRVTLLPSLIVPLQISLDDIASITSAGGTTDLGAGDFVAGQSGMAAAFANGKYARFPVTNGSQQNVNVDKGEIEFWFLPNYSSSSGDDSEHVMVVIGDIYNVPRLEIVESDRIRFTVVDANYNSFTAQADYHQDLFTPGQWVKVRADWDNSHPTDSVRLYLNDQRIDAGGVPGGWSVGNALDNGYIFVGAGDAAGEFPADGAIDEFVIRGPYAPPVNGSPVLATIGNRTAIQGQTLTFTANATDPENNGLVFSLDAGAPDGTVINASSGVFAWTPGFDVSPGVYPVTIRVTDDGAPPASDSETIQITVDEGIVVPVVPSGPALTGLLEGDVGAQPAGSYVEITSLEMRNDQATGRTEVAWAGIPVPRALNLTATDQLAVIGPNNRRVAAQFNVISRWGGTVGQTALPIRWLQVATAAKVNPADRSYYSLRKYDTLSNATDGLAATIQAQASQYVVDTGLATFTLDPANPALIAQIAIDDDNDGIGRTTIYTHSAGAGPKLVFLSGATPVTLSTATAGQVTVDNNGFSVLEQGPVKVVVELKGHFSDSLGRSLYISGALNYERFGYTLTATFKRASRNVELEFVIRNEAGDAFNPPWTDDIVTIRSCSWEMPFSFDAGRDAFMAGGGAVARYQGATSVVAEQRRGAGTPWLRRAHLVVDGGETSTSVSYVSPIAAGADTRFMAAGQIGWMRYREPQAVALDGNTLSLRFFSEDQIVGEAKGIWNMAKVSISPVGGQSASQRLQTAESLREQGKMQVERGLLVRVPLAFVNASQIYASMGTNAPSVIKTAYLQTMNQIHNNTVQDGAQWDRAKTFGSQVWPDILLDEFVVDNATPADNNPHMDYWNPSGAELFEYLRSGDPKWVWDFALPVSWLQMHTAYYNIGDHTQGNRNGFAVTSGGSGDGQWHRSASGSDDYTYDVGMSTAYAIRPVPSVRDRFQQAGRTAIQRYSIPKANEASREEFVNQIAIVRQILQHFELLANDAEFVPGADGIAADAKLNEVVTELAQDNLRAGVMSDSDVPPTTNLSEPQQFMQNAMMYPFFYRYLRNYGDIGTNLIRRGLSEGPRVLYQYGMEKQANGTSLLVSGGWASRLLCTLGSNGTVVVDATRGLDSDTNLNMYNYNKAHTLALMLMAHDLDPSVNLRAVAREALDDPNLTQYWSANLVNSAGWWKGAAQMMQSMIFGVGLYDDPAP